MPLNANLHITSLKEKVKQGHNNCGHDTLVLLPWSMLTTHNCTAVNWSHKTFGQQQGGCLGRRWSCHKVAQGVFMVWRKGAGLM